jgi:CBS domain-containing protein
MLGIEKGLFDSRKAMSDCISAREFMRSDLITLRPGTPVLDGVFRLLEQNISGAPVVEENQKYLGVFSEKCCFEALTNLVDGAGCCGLHVPKVEEFMNRRVITLTPEDEVFDAIDRLLKHHISGAPVVDAQGKYQGIFSEKTAMQVIIGAVYERVPGGEVARYTDLDRNRLIEANASLYDAAQRFLQTPYRRLPVLEDEKLIGQVSRRDVLRSEYQLALSVGDKIVAALPHDESIAQFRTGTIGDFMDCHALTKTPQTDLLGVAEAFLNSPYRRLPVVENGRLVGQISRRDLLSVASRLIRPAAAAELSGAKPLYLSSVSDTIPPQFSR